MNSRAEVCVGALGDGLDGAAEAHRLRQSGGRIFAGESVSLWKNTLVVGATDDDTPAGADAGSAYVFVRLGTAWAEQQKLTASDGAPGDKFGNSVSVADERVVVGAQSDDTPAGIDAGSTYVFTRSGTAWTEQQKLTASDGAAGDEFGSSVSALSDDTVVVGAPGHVVAGVSRAGSAYVLSEPSADPIVRKTDRVDSVLPGGVSRI